MKKLMSIILAATMVFGLAATAMAEDPATTQTNTANSGAGSQAVEIAFEVPETFTWTIPNLENMQAQKVNDILEFGVEESISISDCYLAANHHIEIHTSLASLGFEDEELREQEGAITLESYVKGKEDDAVYVRPTEGSIDIPFKIELTPNWQEHFKGWCWADNMHGGMDFRVSIEETSSADEPLVIHTNEEMQSLDYVQSHL